MSEEHKSPADDPAGPEPVALRFFGTTWVHHDGGYALRRAGVALGALVLAVLGAFVLRFAFEGLAVAEVGSLVNVLIVVCFAVCSVLAFRRTWEGFVRHREPAADRAAEKAEKSAQSLMMIGFIGSLLAYFCRALIEAPGEKLHRAEYEAARERHARRRTARTGNPAARKAGAKSGAKSGAKTGGKGKKRR
ncbi:hypothetical protein [Streptomyces sp. NPDC053560]|uniref:hypothetical protein n=1 Tax=Streptomyces sp. NPDC053560 TaxID=3365711 RepID=UPI0037D92EBB